MTKFAETFGIASNNITSQQVFKWIGDSIVSTIKMLTHLSVYTQEVAAGLSKVFGGAQGGFSNDFAQKGAGIGQLIGAGAKAKKAADAIKFAPDIAAGSGETQRNKNTGGTTVNVNINRAKVDAQDIIRDINATLKTQGSTRLLR
jgi:hypothetical protein